MKNNFKKTREREVPYTVSCPWICGDETYYFKINFATNSAGPTFCRSSVNVPGVCRVTDENSKRSFQFVGDERARTVSIEIDRVEKRFRVCRSGDTAPPSGWRGRDGGAAARLPACSSCCCSRSPLSFPSPVAPLQRRRSGSSCSCGRRRCFVTASAPTRRRHTVGNHGSAGARDNNER